MQRIKHDHARGDGNVVFDQFAAITVATKDFESCVSHSSSAGSSPPLNNYFCSTICFKSGGISAIGA
jgi:hypothetical protein